MTRPAPPAGVNAGRLWTIAALWVALLTGCATSHEKRTAYYYKPAYGVASEEFERALVAFEGELVSGNDAVLLNNGDGFFPAILEAIGAAQKSVNIELYIFAKGRTAETFVEALCKKAREGVQVRLLVDALGERLRRADERRMQAAGVKFQIHKPNRLRSLSKVSDRTHRKIITVDGRIGFTGGLSIDDRWAGDARNPKEWRDTVVRLEGPVVLQMQRLFLQHWLYTTGEVLDGNGQFPANKPAGQMKAQAIGSSRTSQLSMAKLHYYLPIQAARSCVWIENAYFLPDADFMAALVAAAQRGVDVRVLVPGKHIDLKALRYASRRRYHRLLEAGVRLYEFRPTMLHSKVMMVDDIWCSIGSINFTPRSMKSNAEANVALYDTEFARQVRANIEADLVRCRAITLERWKKRGPFERIKECYYSFYEWIF